MTKTLYLFDPATFIFAGTYEAQPSPMEPGKFIAPDASTDKPVPALADNEAAVFDVQADAWTVVPDFRGQAFYNQTTGAEVVIDALGAVPANLAATKPVSILRGEVWGKIKAKRDTLRFEGGVKVGAHWFQSTAVATSEYNTLLLLSAALPDTTVLRAGWRTMGGATVDMTPALVKQILGAGFAQVAAIDDAAQVHRAAMEAAADPSAYNYSAGWPAVFPG